MSVKENKAVVKRWIEILNDRRFEAFGQVLAKNYVLYNAGTSSWSPTAEGLEHAEEVFRKGFADYPTFRVSVDDIVGERDTVATRQTYYVEGKPVAHTMAFFKFSDGKIEGDWACTTFIDTDTTD